MPRLKVRICSALTEDVFQKLKEASLLNVVDFVSCDPEQICQKTGVAFTDVLSIRRVILAQHTAYPVGGNDYYDDVMLSVAILSTGCETLDGLLDGGIYTSEVTELVGEAGSGKSQMCLCSALTVAKDLKQNVIYFDTGGSFDLQRLQGLLLAQNISDQCIEDICARIKICQTFDVFELLRELECLKDSLSQQIDPFAAGLKLIIVDCVASVISPILGGHKSDGHAYMMYLARCLKSLAVDYSTAVLITNNAVQGDHDVTKPALGKTWSHVPNTRLHIERYSDEVETNTATKKSSSHRKATLIKSCKQVLHNSVCFKITEKGLENIAQNIRSRDCR